MKKYGILIILALITLSACSDNARLIRKEDRLIGAWEFEKAFYKENNALFRDNITEEFEGDLLEFFGDYSTAYDDLDTGQVFFGDWELFLVRENWDGDEDVEFFLDMFFFDDRGFPAFEYFTSVNRLTKERMELTAIDRRGRYTFRMRKL